MNRHGWLSENDPVAMFVHVHPTAPPRKLRLALAGCLRQAIEPISERDPLAARHLLAVGLLERFADGAESEVLIAAERAALAGDVPIRNALRAALAVPLRPEDLTAFCTELRASLFPEVRIANRSDSRPQVEALAAGVWSGMLPGINGWMCATVRDVFGDPFDPVEVSPGWRTRDVQAVARRIYEGRDWGRMPVLADALLDAGCEDEPVLSHCRQARHVRGCWLVDGLLVG